MRLRVIDLETTGFEPPAEIIEFGFTDVVYDDFGIEVSEPTAWLYRPLKGIPPETKAVHHLTEVDFPADMSPCTPGHLHAALNYQGRPDVLVAHNCAFERKFVTPEATGAIPWICTYKVALHLWPDAPGHSNQVLRYWRDLALDATLANPPHRAGPDAWVTAHLLADLLLQVSVEQMVQWTRQPKHMPRITFGMHKGSEWSVLPASYLQWMTGQATMDEDAVWHAKQELLRRG